MMKPSTLTPSLIEIRLQLENQIYNAEERFNLAKSKKEKLQWLNYRNDLKGVLKKTVPVPERWGDKSLYAWLKWEKSLQSKSD